MIGPFSAALLTLVSIIFFIAPFAMIYGALRHPDPDGDAMMLFVGIGWAIAVVVGIGDFIWGMVR
jgi:hypothetical protein